MLYVHCVCVYFLQVLVTFDECVCVHVFCVCTISVCVKSACLYVLCV